MKDHWSQIIITKIIMKLLKYFENYQESVSVTQSCPTLCSPMDCSLPGSSAQGVLQARILECVAIPSSRESSWPRDWTWISYIAGGFFTVWATREAPFENYQNVTYVHKVSKYYQKKNDTKRFAQSRDAINLQFVKEKKKEQYLQSEMQWNKIWL